MNPELLKMFGRLGQGPHAAWIGGWLALQLIISFLLLVCDAGFPVWIIIGLWLLFLGVAGVLAVRSHYRERGDHEAIRTAWREQHLRVERLREALRENPHHETPCALCRHFDPSAGICQLNVSSGDRQFRFRRADPRCYCLGWQKR